MKKLLSIVFVIIVMSFISSCNKKDDFQPVKKTVDAIQGTYHAQDGDLTLKSADLTGANRTWYMYRKAPAGSPYGWELVNGDEFIENTTPWTYWKNPANNPATIGITDVYSNLTPVEDLRMVCETKNAAGEVAYMGITDFYPTMASFPLSIVNNRVGDKLIVNKDQIAALPGYTIMSVKAICDMGVIDPLKTRMFSTTTAAGVWPKFEFSSVLANQTFEATGTGDIVLYDGLNKKITGTVVTIEVKIDGATITKTVPVPPLGYGLKVKITTTRVGWFDSATIGVSENDIQIKTETVEV